MISATHSRLSVCKLSKHLTARCFLRASESICQMLDWHPCPLSLCIFPERLERLKNFPNVCVHTTELFKSLSLLWGQRSYSSFYPRWLIASFPGLGLLSSLFSPLRNFILYKNSLLFYFFSGCSTLAFKQIFLLFLLNFTCVFETVWFCSPNFSRTSIHPKLALNSQQSSCFSFSNKY